MCDCSVLATIYTELESLLTYCNDIHKAEHRSKDTRGNNNTPQRQTQVIHASSLLVEVTKRVEAQYYHRKTKTEKPRFRAEKRPIFSKVSLKDTKLGYNQESRNYTGTEMRNPIKEEKLEQESVSKTCDPRE